MNQKLDSSTADKLLREAEKKAKRKSLSKEEFAELKKACRSLFMTRNGKKVARAMMKISGIYRYPKNNTNPVLMGEENGMATMYAFFILNMVSHEQRMEIEKGE